MKTAPVFLHHPCSPSSVLMNGADKFAMTGPSGAPRDHLGWIANEQGPPVKKGRFAMVTQNTASGGVSSPLFLSSPTVFSPPAVVTRNVVEARMFAPTFQAERTRHMQPTSVPLGGSSTTLYYSQAPRNQNYNFFPATYSAPMTFAASPTVTTSSVLPPEGQRSYLQVENFQSQISAQSVGSHSQIPAYLQHPTHSSPSPTIGHNRLFQQGRSILIGRFPEEAGEREQPTHVRIQLSPVVTQVHEEPSQRQSESHHSPTLPIEAPPTEQHNSTSSYRLPTGKEGSLKHRILRPPSINIVDPPPTALIDAPLSAPPIRSQRDSSPKHPRSVPSSGYRSFSSSASSLAASSGTSPSSTLPTHPSSPTSPTQLKYPQSFMRGAIIQLANNKLKQVEDMTTEDFLESSALSSTLRVDSSTVTAIDKMPASGAAKLSFQVGQDNIQITVEAPLEHPFFVYKQGWSSCSPERSAQRYGLECHRLKVGDTLITLTDKPRATTTNGAQKGNSANGPDRNCCVSFKGVKTLNDEKSLETLIAAKSEEASNCSASFNGVKTINDENALETLIVAKCEEAFASAGKRKRRWSAPDNVPPKEDDGTSL